MTDLEILDVFNDIIAPQDASIADPANRPVEIPKGRPQIECRKSIRNGQREAMC